MWPWYSSIKPLKHKDMKMAEQITVQDLNAKLLNHDPITIIDVREDDEIAISKLDSAIHIPMNDVPNHLDKLTKDSPLYIICRSGKRSDTIANFLNGLGYTAINVAGGMQAWQQHIDPSIEVA